MNKQDMRQHCGQRRLQRVAGRHRWTRIGTLSWLIKSIWWQAIWLLLC